MRLHAKGKKGSKVGNVDCKYGLKRMRLLLNSFQKVCVSLNHTR